MDRREAARGYMSRWERLKQERSSWEAHWRELQDYLRPRGSRFLQQNGQGRGGVKMNGNIINGTPVRAQRILAAGMMAAITSPSRRWFKLGPGDRDLEERPAVKDWLAAVETQVLLAYAKAFVYPGLWQMYSDLGTFGTAAAILDEDENEVLRLYNLPVGQFCLSQSPRLAVDTLYRETAMTVRQLVDRFGDACSDNTLQAYDRRQYDDWREVLHCIHPGGEGWHYADSDSKGKPFQSTWVELTGSSGGPMGAASASQGGGGNGHLLGTEGYYEFPVLAPRWARTGEDVYGYGPGMEALPDSKQLQLIEADKLSVLAKVVRPPLNVPPQLESRRVSLNPGAANYANGAGKVEPLLQVDPRAFQFASEEIANCERRVKEAFFADLWLMLQEMGNHTMTATEVAQRQEEKLLQLGPVVQNLQNELVKPLVERTYAILARRGMLPPPPPEMEGQEVRIEFISIMAKAQKLLDSTALRDFAGRIVELSAASPATMDKVDWDEWTDQYAEALDIPRSIIRADDVVAQLREQKAQQAQQQQQMAQMQQGAAVAKELGQASTESSALGEMLKQVGAR